MHQNTISVGNIGLFANIYIEIKNQHFLSSHNNVLSTYLLSEFQWISCMSEYQSKHGMGDFLNYTGGIWNFPTIIITLSGVWCFEVDCIFIIIWVGSSVCSETKVHSLDKGTSLIFHPVKYIQIDSNFMGRQKMAWFQVKNVSANALNVHLII